jgi:hypothetical protein
MLFGEPGKPFFFGDLADQAQVIAYVLATRGAERRAYNLEKRTRFPFSRVAKSLAGSRPLADRRVFKASPRHEVMVVMVIWLYGIKENDLFAS